MKLQIFLDLFKIFFPSWKFFDESGDNIKLYYKYFEKGNSDYSNWFEINLKQRRELYKLLFNSKTNLVLNIESHLQIFLESLETSNNNEEYILYHKIIQNLIEYTLTEANIKSIKYQFKIKSYSNMNDNESVLFISEEFNTNVLCFNELNERIK